MAENKVVHAAQRAAFSVAIDAAIKAVRGKGTEHMTEEAVKLINLAEPLLSKRYILPPIYLITNIGILRLILSMLKIVVL